MKYLIPILAAGALASQALDAAAPDNWSQWRGPLGTGEAPGAKPPTTWSETQNVKWKFKIPGYGTSTPIIWGDQVFILTAEASGPAATPAPAAPAAEPAPAERPAEPGAPGGGRRRRGGPGGGGRGEAPDKVHRWSLISVDRATGKERWRTVLKETVPHEGHHQDHGFASFTPVTDGERIYLHLGSRGLHCLDMKGKVVWAKDLGQLRTRNGFGEGGSLALHGSTLIISRDHEGTDDFVAAFEAKTGKEMWRKERDEATGWSTPLVVESGGKAQVVVNATGKVRAYDVATGTEVWSTSGMTANAIPTPVASKGVVYVTSGYRGASLMAIRADAKGDLATSDAILWRASKNTPYVPSPLLVGDRLYLYSGNNAMLSVFDTQTGKPVIDAERVPGLNGVYASPIAADGRVYLVGRDGSTVVAKQGDKFEILATNKLDDAFDASPAAIGKELYLRGHAHLYCLSE